MPGNGARNSSKTVFTIVYNALCSTIMRHHFTFKSAAFAPLDGLGFWFYYSIFRGQNSSSSFQYTACVIQCVIQCVLEKF